MLNRFRSALSLQEDVFSRRETLPFFEDLMPEEGQPKATAYSPAPQLQVPLRLNQEELIKVLKELPRRQMLAKKKGCGSHWLVRSQSYQLSMQMGLWSSSGSRQPRYRRHDAQELLRGFSVIVVRPNSQIVGIVSIDTLYKAFFKPIYKGVLCLFSASSPPRARGVHFDYSSIQVVVLTHTPIHL